MESKFVSNQITSAKMIQGCKIGFSKQFQQILRYRDKFTRKHQVNFNDNT